MNSREFIYYWSDVVSDRWPKEPSQWTDEAFRLLHAVADRAGLWCACNHQEPVDRKSRSDDAPARPIGEKREYLFDLTWYESVGSDDDYALPQVIIEHENQHNFEEFYFDFWKTLVGYAPLRVAIGYCNKPEQREEWMKELNRRAQRMLWKFPPYTEDVIVLGFGGMSAHDYGFYVRPQFGRTWERFEL